MKKIFQKIKSLIPKTTKYFFDFVVVFIGVFLAFWLNARKEEQIKEAEQVQIYRAIYEDINEFYLAGREENKDGFVNVFEKYKNQLDSLIAIKKIPAKRRFYGDYWHLEIVNSLTGSEKLTTLDAPLWKGLANFNTSHQMFLGEIEAFNKAYENYITAHYEEGMDYFYKADSNEPLERIKIIQSRLNRIISLSKMLVQIAENAKIGLEQEFNFK
jgi:hypothetical protein